MVGQILIALSGAEQQQAAATAPVPALAPVAEQQQQSATTATAAAAEKDMSKTGGIPQHHYAICVTGDHSTPVVFGDHSHEPVPFALTWVRDAVAAAGGQGEGQVPLGHKIPLPDTKQSLPLVELQGRL